MDIEKAFTKWIKGKFESKVGFNSEDIWKGGAEWERNRLKTNSLTRLEVIDHRQASINAETGGRILVVGPQKGIKIELMYQDEGKTLKVFLS